MKEDCMSEVSQAEVGRRAFHGLAVAAVAGLLAGTSQPNEAEANEQAPGGRKPKRVNLTSSLLLEPNICRGLNICKGKGRGDGFGGPNRCAGMSACATAPAHVCAGSNECRGLGACDVGDPVKYQVGYPGENTCKGKGACGVPIPVTKDHVWRKVRQRFECLMADAGGRAGPAPARQ
jgi:hypothetical protein